MIERKAIFNLVFSDCLSELFSDRPLSIFNEIEDYVTGKITEPPPRACGLHRTRIKLLLPKNNVIVMYWDYGSVWEFFCVIEPNNKIHLQVFRDILLAYNTDHKK
jgi:hypothetical protein